MKRWRLRFQKLCSRTCREESARTCREERARGLGETLGTRIEGLFPQTAR